MKLFIKTGRYFYAIALLVYGVQQFVYADFRNVLLPAWQSKIPLLPVWAYIFGLALIAAGVAIIFEKKAREVSLILGGTLLVLFCFVHIPYEIIDPKAYDKHLGSWTSALKELALSGGAFVIAGTFSADNASPHHKSAVMKLLEKIIPFGPIFFSITMTSFGITHFMYAGFVEKMVPSMFPDHLFWTYFAGVALIGSGVFIILNIRVKAIGILLGTMIFLWFILLHIPGAIANPYVNRGNELSSAFDALAFSGTAFVIAFGVRHKEFDKIN